jgi:hypothetical protein
MKFYLISFLVLASYFVEPSLAAKKKNHHKEVVPNFKLQCDCPPDNCPAPLLSKKAVSNNPFEVEA